MEAFQSWDVNKCSQQALSAALQENKTLTSHVMLQKSLQWLSCSYSLLLQPDIAQTTM